MLFALLSLWPRLSSMMALTVPAVVAGPPGVVERAVQGDIVPLAPRLRGRRLAAQGVALRLFGRRETRVGDGDRGTGVGRRGLGLHGWPSVWDTLIVTALC